MTPALPPPASITHLHILATVNSRIARLKGEHQHLRVCDMGCGDGRLLGYLARCLPALHPGTTFEFFGVEVGDSGVQPAGFFDRTLATLTEAAPEVAWTDRLHMITSDAPWPFADDYLHLVVSNQVVEHVGDHALFFGETHRTLSDGGLGVHLFPSRHVWWEGHIHLPFVHRIGQHALQQSFIRACSRLGLGAYAAHRRDFGMTLPYYAEEHADYINFLTNYRTTRELLAFAKAARLRADFLHTPQFYWAKLRAKLRRAPRLDYGPARPWRDTMLLPFLKRAASITMTVEKRQTYAR